MPSLGRKEREGKEKVEERKKRTKKVREAWVVVDGWWEACKRARSQRKRLGGGACKRRVNVPALRHPTG